MLFQRAGLQIKKLISHRRNRTLQNSDSSSLFGQHSENITPSRCHKRQSWISQGTTVELGVLRNTTNSFTTRSHPAPASVTSVRISSDSSSSSLCSRDSCVDVASISHSLSKPRAASGTTSTDILYLPPIKSTTSTGDAETWRLIFSENQPRSPNLSSQRFHRKNTETCSTRVSTGPTFDIFEALAIDPSDDEKTPTPSIKGMVDLKMGGFSDNIEQLMREADAAFEAVGSALVDAETATEQWYDAEIACDTQNMRVSWGMGKHHRQLSPTSQNTFVSKGKRKQSAKKANLQTRLEHNIRAPTAASTVRLTLTDMTSNIADVLSAKMCRTKVDEILTPDRMQQLKESMVESKRETSFESNRSSGSDGSSTQAEPFQLEDLSSRIDAAKGNQTLPLCPVLPPAALPQSQRGPNSPPNIPIKFAQRPASGPEMIFKNLSFPSPPCTPPSSKASRPTPFLPTIPEASPLTSVQMQVQPSIKKRASYIDLPSTPLTLTSPLFHHGSIRIECGKERRGSATEDESLDWTAFQIAISGGVDEYDQQQIGGNEWGIYEAELDDIKEWWDGFGFEGLGNLIRESPKKGRVKIDNSWYLEDSSPGKDRKGGVAIGLARELGQWKNTADKQDANTEAQSLPTSPMLDLVVQSKSSKDEDVVPMGFNLGHDLGDFLKWETQHAHTFNRG